MRDPDPSNISGEKVQRHVFKHEVNWGYVVLGLAGLYAIYRLGDFVNRGDKNQDPGLGTEV